MIFQDHQEFLDVVSRMAGLAGERILEHFRRLDSSEISLKTRNDHVTIADREAETVIVEAVRKRFPEHGILAEEGGREHGSAEQPLWIIDPLDGTTNFVHGIAHFAVSIGILSGSDLQYGLIYDPFKKDLFSFARGEGVFWNGRKCALSSRNGLEGSLLATGFPFKAHQHLDRFLAIFRETFLRAKAIRRTGSAALDLAYTAAGIYDGFFEFSLAPWDLAAGIGMIRELGGLVMDMDGKEGEDPMRVLESGNVLCGAPGVVRELREVVELSAEHMVQKS